MNEKEERLQKLYVEFQVMSNTISQLEKQNNVLENQLMELMVTHKSIEEIKDVKAGTDILVPISSGIYARAELKTTDNFVVNVGSNIVLNKDIGTTKKLIESQIDEIKKMQETLVKELQENTSNAALLEEEIKKIASTIEDK